MSWIKTIALAILVISFFTFVAFFGRLPALRNTPIGGLHRVIWIHTPAGFRKADQYLTNGRVSAWAARTAHTLWNDKHPVVMLFHRLLDKSEQFDPKCLTLVYAEVYGIFFFLLLSVSEIMFIPPALPMMDTALKVKATIAVILPYVFLYLAAYTDPGYITPENNYQALSLYPYDHTIFHPGQTCSTCQLLKPARSKHCSICKRCISKLDHHCIFINNCVGYENQHYFLLLLFTTGGLTTYATKVGLSLLSSQIRVYLANWTLRGVGYSWSDYFDIWMWALQENVRIGAITLLCLLTSPLVWGLLAYHIYLIWAGTTTNESMKWSDWQEEMSEGFAWTRALPSDRVKDESIEPAWHRWPCDSQQILLRTADGQPPRGPEAIGVGEWRRVWKLKDIENLYDLGFWDNLTDVFWFRGVQKHEGVPAGRRENADAHQKPLLPASVHQVANSA